MNREVSIPTHVGKTRALPISLTHCSFNPHTRGENFQRFFSTLRQNFQSPHTWGKRQLQFFSNTVYLSIPTHVGKTFRDSDNSAMLAFNPHTRGENVSIAQTKPFVFFQSPHTWGKRTAQFDKHGSFVSIPTHVGKTNIEVKCAQLRTFNPHTRGENRVIPIYCLLFNFQSPHTWGKRWIKGKPIPGSLSIPTHVGKTIVSPKRKKRDSFNPHTRGENLNKLYNGFGLTATYIITFFVTLAFW